MRRWWIPSLLVVFGLVHLITYWFPFDDLFITLRYGQNLADGVGLRFNPGETVDGFSSFSWVLVSAVVELFGLPADATLKVLCTVSAIALVLWTYREALTRLPSSPLVAGACSLVIVASGGWAFWTMTAMETTPFALLIFAATVGLAGPSRARWWPGVVLGLAALTRPEGIGYAVALIAALATTHRRDALRAAAGAALVFLPYFVWHWVHFGYPLPNTYYAKSSASSAVLWRGVVAVEEYLTSNMAWLLLLGSAWTTVTHWRQPWVRPFAAVSAAALANVVIVGGDTFLFHRFNLPALAPMLVLSAVALDDLRGVLEHKTTRAQASAAGLALLLALWTVTASVTVPVAILSTKQQPPRDGVAWASNANADYQVIGRWLARKMPKGTWLATNAAGIIPYESGLPTIDMLGLNDQHIAHREIELGRGAIGHEKHDAKYVLARRPDLILLGIPTFTAGPVRDGRMLRRIHERWFAYLPGDRQLFFDEEFRDNYVPRSVAVGTGRWLTLFVRKDRLAVITGE